MRHSLLRTALWLSAALMIAACSSSEVDEGEDGTDDPDGRTKNRRVEIVIAKKR